MRRTAQTLIQRRARCENAESSPLSASQPPSATSFGHHDLRRQREPSARSRAGISKRHRQAPPLAAPHQRWLVQARSQGELASRGPLSGQRARSPSVSLRLCAGDQYEMPLQPHHTCGSGQTSTACMKSSSCIVVTWACSLRAPNVRRT